MINLAYQNFYNGDEDIEVVTRKVPENTSIIPGEIVDKGAAVGEIAKSTGTPANAYGIALEAVTTGAGETASIAVLVDGPFNKDKVVYPEGKSIEDYEIPLRNIGIMLIDVVNTEITR